MDVLARARVLERRGIDVVHFELGEPDFPTPERVKLAAVKALTDNATHYTAARGQHELVHAIVDHYKSRYGVTVPQEQIVVSAGTSPVLLMAFLASVDPGDEVIIPLPYYPCYPNFVRMAGGVPVFVEARAEDGFQVTAEAIERAITPRTRAILINSPGNPSGTVLGGDTMRAIAKLGPLIISDEIYHGLTYEGQEHTMLEYTPNAFVANGFSKVFSMTGWRLGYIIIPPAYVRAMEILQQNIIISANSFSQWGGLTALSDGEVLAEAKEMRAAYDERRKVMVDGVRALGLGVPVTPTGAFYVLADARKFGTNTIELAARMLDEAHVAVTPGDDFGAPGFLRFSYTVGVERIREGLHRLKKVLA
jgi:aspartate/methionine/tyrosine aminotransferase